MTKKSIDLKDLNFSRKILFFGGLLYFSWYFAVELLLPEAVNPLLSRLIICGICFVSVFLSFKNDWVRANISRVLAVCIFLVTLHYFYLFVENRYSADWIVGTYITVIASIMCLYASKDLFWYSVGTAGTALFICASNPDLFKTIFFPGLLTILFLGTLGSRSRIKLVENLKESFSRFYILFNSTFEGIVVHDKGRIIEINKPFAAMFGFTSEELIGRRIEDLVAAEYKKNISDKISLDSEKNMEIIGERRDKSTFAMEICTRPYVVDGREVYLSSVRDITERRQIELERIRLAAAEEAVRNRDEFISIASHELKTPLTTIRLQMEMYTREREKGNSREAEGKRTARFVEIVKHQTDRLIRLIEDMLDVTRISQGRLVLNFEPCDLTALAEGVVALEKEARGVDHSIVFDAPYSVMVRADRHRIEQVLTNLVSNAVKYGNNNSIKLSVRAAQNKAVITVEDSGIGIAPENLERIFERFERAIPSKNISGLGLGLYISKQIIDGHGGKIFVESTLGKGSKFTVEIDRIK